MSISLPQGRYLSASGVVRTDTGGQTRAMLMRSRAIGEATGRPVDILSFDPSPRYPAIRRGLYDSGLLTPDMQLLNLFEHVRERGWGPAPGTGQELPVLPGLRADPVRRADGSPWRIAYRNTAGRVVWNDFQRADGSVYLRSAPYGTKHAEILPERLTKVSPDGEILGDLAGLPELYRHWIGEVTAADEQSFLFMDSRFLVPLIAPVDDPSVHLIYVLHNCHTPRPRHWSTPSLPEYHRALARIGDLSAFVTLTERQARDIQRQWGPRPNVFAVQNPVEPPAVPDPLPERDPLQVTAVARLETQKRLSHAILVMDRVRRAVPGARLDIYGSGTRRDALRAVIEARGLGDVVRLRGHDPAARDTLWTSSAFLLTSENEGYPLATLESLSRGCPVVSYDIPYGPSDQLTDGEDGFLVPDGRIAAAAKRVIRLLTSPELVARMSSTARATAARHGPDVFLADWARVLRAVVAQAPDRVHLTSGTAAIRVHSRQRRGLWRVPGLAVRGRLSILARGGQAGPERAVLELVAIDQASGAAAPVPLRVTRRGLDYRFSGRIRPADVLGSLGATSAYLELRFRWANAAWATSLGRRHLATGAVDRSGVGGIDDDTLLIHRPSADDAGRPRRRRTLIQRVASRARRLTARRSSTVSTSRT